MIDLDRLKDVPRVALETLVRAYLEYRDEHGIDMSELGLRLDECADELRAALTPKLRTRSEVDAEIVSVVCDDGLTWNDTLQRLIKLKGEPTAPDPEPAQCSAQPAIMFQAESVEELADQIIRLMDPVRRRRLASLVDVLEPMTDWRVVYDGWHALTCAESPSIQLAFAAGFAYGERSVMRFMRDDDDHPPCPRRHLTEAEEALCWMPPPLGGVWAPDSVAMNRIAIANRLNAVRDERRQQTNAGAGASSDRAVKATPGTSGPPSDDPQGLPDDALETAPAAEPSPCPRRQKPDSAKMFRDRTDEYEHRQQTKGGAEAAAMRSEEHRDPASAAPPAEPELTREEQERLLAAMREWRDKRRGFGVMCHLADVPLSLARDFVVKKLGCKDWNSGGTLVEDACIAALERHLADLDAPMRTGESIGQFCERTQAPERCGCEQSLALEREVEHLRQLLNGAQRHRGELRVECARLKKRTVQLEHLLSEARPWITRIGTALTEDSALPQAIDEALK